MIRELSLVGLRHTDIDSRIPNCVYSLLIMSVKRWAANREASKWMKSSLLGLLNISLALYKPIESYDEISPQLVRLLKLRRKYIYICFKKGGGGGQRYESGVHHHIPCWVSSRIASYLTFWRWRTALLRIVWRYITEEVLGVKESSMTALKGCWENARTYPRDGKTPWRCLPRVEISLKFRWNWQSMHVACILYVKSTGCN